MKDFYLVLLSLEIFNIGFSIDFEKYTIDDKSSGIGFEFIFSKKRKHIELIMFHDYSLIFSLK